ncbi:hypothetical protein IJT10_06530, partial [bacterium]|nr:hypothetical protein [bacterium]
MRNLKRKIYFIVGVILAVFILNCSEITQAESPEDGVAPSLIEIPDTLDDPADKVKKHKVPSVAAPSSFTKAKKKSSNKSANNNKKNNSSGFPWGHYNHQENNKKNQADNPKKIDPPKQNNVAENKTNKIKGASSDLPLQLVISKEKTIKIEVKSKQYPVVVRPTNVDDEYLVPVDDSGMRS